MKKINKSCDTKLLYQSDWLVEQDVCYNTLTICPRARLIAPEGKFITLMINGVGHDIEPGTYHGDVRLVLGDTYTMAPHALMKQNNITYDMEAVVVVGNEGADVRVPAMLQRGTVTDTEADGIAISTQAQSYNGLVITGDQEYTIRNSSFDFEGFSCNDFLGVGSAVAAIDNAKVTIENCAFNFSGVTRCAIHVGGRSNVVTRNCEVINFSPASTWNDDFSWQIDLRGSNRLCQLADGAKATYENCTLISNGWGITSIDGTSEPVSLTIDGCKMRLVGPRAHGYGAFCIGDNDVTIKNSDVVVNGYPMLVMGMKEMGRPSILNSQIRGNRFGAMVYSDSGSIFDIADSSFVTGKSTLVVKGSNTIINIANSTMEPGNGTILQLMDNDECGMNAANCVIPVGEVDTYVEGRDLTTAKQSDDIILNVKDCTLTGNFFNSSTNLRIRKRSKEGGKGLFHDTLMGLPGMDDGEEAAAMPAMPPMPAAPKPGEGSADAEDGPDIHKVFDPIFKDNSGPKNLELNLTNTAVTGIISSALQAYRPGITEITAENRCELSNVTQTAAPTVNNGVIVNLDASSSWTVTETSYITALTLAEGAVLAAPAGKTLTMTVDGTETAPAAGSYTGTIVLTVA